jgi:nucleotide-binding universal stress UspA family protein
MIKDLLVHLDDTPASPARLEAALALATTCGARVTALYLIAEPFLRGVAGQHAPAEVIREHLAEAEKLLAAAQETAVRRQVRLRTQRATGSLDRLPGLLARDARNTDLVIVGQPDLETGGSDETLLVEAAFLETGRPALVLPPAGARAPTTGAATRRDRLGRLARGGARGARRPAAPASGRGRGRAGGGRGESGGPDRPPARDRGGGAPGAARGGRAASDRR